MNIKQIKDLHASMAMHGYSELNLELKGQSNLKLVIDESLTPAMQIETVQSQDDKIAEFPTTQIEIRSDKVGTFSFKDREIKLNDEIKKGEIIGIVDGISFKEIIKCSVNGVVTSVNIAEGEVVDYGRLLFVVDI